MKNKIPIGTRIERYKDRIIYHYPSGKKFIERNRNKFSYAAIIEERRDRTIYRYPSGKTFVKHKSMSKTYGDSYDWRCDG